MSHRSTTSKVLILGLAISFLLTGTNSYAAAKVTPKPGAVVKATSQEKLVVGKIGFADESNCVPDSFRNVCKSDSTYNYRTTWAFSVVNQSPNRSASNVRAQVIFLDAQGNELLKTIVTVAREIKPRKLAWVAASEDETTMKITGVVSVTAKIVANSWIIPTKSIFQNPITLTSTSRGFWYKCQVSLPCEKIEGGAGYLTKVELSGVFTWRGTTGVADRQIIFLDSNNNPIGGRSRAQVEYQTGSQAVSNELYLTAYEMGNIVTFLYAVSN